jgi:hypothetical protein
MLRNSGVRQSAGERGSLSFVRLLRQPAGITVITTLNMQHIASVNDVVVDITGIRQQETVPDWVLDLADDVELVDISPSALQRRMVHGNIYRDPRKGELALNRFFTTDNLTALRELALMRVANRVDDTLLARWSKTRTPETRERVLVCVSRPGVSEDLIGRGGRIAQRSGGELLVLHVSTGEKESDRRWLEQGSTTRPRPRGRVPRGATGGSGGSRVVVRLSTARNADPGLRIPPVALEGGLARILLERAHP